MPAYPLTFKTFFSFNDKVQLYECDHVSFCCCFVRKLYICLAYVLIFQLFRLMNRNTPIVKSFFNPVVFGLYFIFFFTQLNYLSKYYFPQVTGHCSYKNQKGSKKNIVEAAQKQHGSKTQVKLNKRYYPKNPFKAPAHLLSISPAIIILTIERFTIAAPIQRFPPLSTFERGPPFIS